MRVPDRFPKLYLFSNKPPYIMLRMKSTPQNRLLQARKEAGIDQHQAALHLGITQAAYSDLEQSQTPNSRQLIEIAALLGVSPLWIVEGKEPKHLNDPDEASNTEMLQMLATLSTDDLADLSQTID